MSKLFVGNLAYLATEPDIRAAFQGVGIVLTQVKIVLDHDSGRPRGFGFVETDEDAQVTIDATNGMLIMGRSVTVTLATPRKPRPGQVVSRERDVADVWKEDNRRFSRR